MIHQKHHVKEPRETKAIFEKKKIFRKSLYGVTFISVFLFFIIHRQWWLCDVILMICVYKWCFFPSFSYDYHHFFSTFSSLFSSLVYIYDEDIFESIRMYLLYCEDINSVSLISTYTSFCTSMTVTLFSYQVYNFLYPYLLLLEDHIYSYSLFRFFFILKPYLLVFSF